MSRNFLAMLPEFRMFRAVNMWRAAPLLKPMGQIGLREYKRKGPVLRNKFQTQKIM